MMGERGEDRGKKKGGIFPEVSEGGKKWRG